MLVLIGHINLFANGVVTRAFGRLEITWQEKPGSATKAVKFWNHKSDQIKLLNSLPELSCAPRSIRAS